MKLAALILLSALLSGCASLFEPPKAEVQIVDTFCLREKRKWSINDSVESIRDAEVYNAAIDKKCRAQKGKTS